MSSAAAPEAEIELLAPLRGWVLPLAEVPDPVFAGGLAGDGVAIDPTGGVLHAPCAGVVMTMPGGSHALTIRSAGGDVLLHVGIDTVTLQGKGFELQVRDGETVSAGQPLLRFDLDGIVRAAPSAITPVLVAAPGRVLRRVSGQRVEAGDFLMALAPVAAPAAVAAAGGVELKGRFRVPFDHGLHARPAARVAAALEAFQSSVTIEARGRIADARSTVALMSLGAGRGDVVGVTVRGADAQSAFDALTAMLEPIVAAAAAVAPVVVPVPPPPGSRVRAQVAVPGLATGVAVPLLARDVEIAPASGDAAQEQTRLTQALAQVIDSLRRAAGEGEGPQREIVAAHAALLEDRQLRQAASVEIRRGASAGAAWRKTLRDAAATLGELDDPRMRERRADLLDIEQQVLTELAGAPRERADALPDGAIVLARELLPSQLLALDRSRVAGLCMAEGGATSHVAILAASLGLPTLVAAGESCLAVEAGTRLVLDGEAGFLHVEPSDGEWTAVQSRMAAREAQRRVDLVSAHRPAVARSGETVHVQANLGGFTDAETAVQSGADGCGLLRTEFLFLERSHAPTVDEQWREYQAIATALVGRPLTIRTLDAGGDKPLAYLPQPREENPALGLRGIRTSLHQPQLLDAQLQAILRVAPAGQCRVLLPMINDLDDVRAVRARLDECARHARQSPPLLGVMIETPAAALLADQLAAEVDFFSIGSNDLSQYTLAMDRQHPVLAGRLDALHPAVLRLIARVCDAASARTLPVAVCGGLASDPLAVPILLGLGIRELSVVPLRVPAIKGQVRHLSLADCSALAMRVLSMQNASQVREHVARWLDGVTGVPQP